MAKVLQELFWVYFFGCYTVQTVPNTPGCSTGDPSNGGDDFEMRGG